VRRVGLSGRRPTLPLIMDLTEPTEAVVIAAVGCMHTGCKARPGRACKESGDRHYYPRTRSTAAAG
jgi:hypothetical protein